MKLLDMTIILIESIIRKGIDIFNEFSKDLSKIKATFTDKLKNIKSCNLFIVTKSKLLFFK